jgi:hypothetical protein
MLSYLTITEATFLTVPIFYPAISGDLILASRSGDSVHFQVIMWDLLWTKWHWTLTFWWFLRLLLLINIVQLLLSHTCLIFQVFNNPNQGAPYHLPAVSCGLSILTEHFPQDSSRFITTGQEKHNKMENINQLKNHVRPNYTQGSTLYLNYRD